MNKWTNHMEMCDKEALSGYATICVRLVSLVIPSFQKVSKKLNRTVCSLLCLASPLIRFSILICAVTALWWVQSFIMQLHHDLSVLQWMDICVVSSSGLWWIKLLWIFCTFLWMRLTFIFVSKEVEFLDEASVCSILVETTKPRK